MPRCFAFPPEARAIQFYRSKNLLQFVFCLPPGGTCDTIHVRWYQYPNSFCLPPGGTCDTITCSSLCCLPSFCLPPGGTCDTIWPRHKCALRAFCLPDRKSTRLNSSHL